MTASDLTSHMSATGKETCGEHHEKAEDLNEDGTLTEYERDIEKTYVAGLVTTS